MSGYKAPLGPPGRPGRTGVWGAIPDLKQYLHKQNLPIRLWY